MKPERPRMVRVRYPERDAAMLGKTFGRLTVLERAGSSPNKSILFRCSCSCGGTAICKGQHIRSGEIRSCGCLSDENRRISRPIHGHTIKGLLSGTYASWGAMKCRCKHKNHPAYHRYGGRGITICERWNKFANFLADMGERPVGMELDRINNDGNYEKSNCRWVTPTQQGRNRSTNRVIEIDGESKCISEWSEMTGTKKTTIKERLNKGWSGKDAVYGRNQMEKSNA